jgi:L-amino acid N-acyltransferase YncA
MVWRRYRSFRLVLIGAATKYHRTGLGKVALFETIRRLRARGAKELSCAWVLQSNSALIRILIDFKFRKSAIYNVYEKHLLN